MIKSLINNYFKNLSVLMLVCSFLVGCSVGPNYKKPQFELPQKITREESKQDVYSVEINQDWWKSYGSKEINQLVELALKNNPNIDVGIANLRVAQKNVVAQQGFFFPSIGAGYALSRQNIGKTLSSNLSSGDMLYNLHTASVSVGFVPDIFGGNRRQVESLKALANAQSYQLQALKISIASNVVAAAIQEASLREQVKAVQELAEAARLQLEHARRLRAAGYYSAVDLAVQETLYAQAVAQVPTIEKSREQTLDLLAVLCGKMPSEPLLLPSLLSIQVPDKLPRSVQSSLVAQRPDVKIADELLRAANAQIGVTIANMLPQISISGTFGSSATLFGDLSNSANNFWAGTGIVSQPVFAGGTLFARKAAAEAGRDASLAQYKSTVLTAFQNVADTLYALDADGRYYKTALDNEVANQSLYEMSQKQLQTGYISEAAMLNTKQTYLQARINALQAYATYLGDTTALYQTLGGGWSEHTAQVYRH